MLRLKLFPPELWDFWDFTQFSFLHATARQPTFLHLKLRLFWFFHLHIPLLGNDNYQMMSATECTSNDGDYHFQHFLMYITASTVKHENNFILAVTTML